MKAVFAALVLLLAAPSYHARSLLAVEEADVVIVGAGMAGVTVARNLTDAGYKVIVLEATNRTAGRLKSTPTEQGGRVDLGAMWIHEGQPGNELYDLVTRDLKLPISGRMNYNSITQYTPSGDRGNRRGYLGVLAGWTDMLLNITRLRSSGTSEDFPMAALYSDWLAKNPQFSQEQVWQANSLMHSTWQALLNANITALSTLRYGDAKVLPAVDVMLEGGFDSVVRALEPGLDIRLNAVVTNINYSGSSSVVVTTSNGTQYRGRLAVLTPSLGVLKRSVDGAPDATISFTPELPAYKQQAIRDMGFGVLDKAVLVFEKPFWDLDSDFINVEAVDWSGLWTVFLNYHKLFKMPVLVAVHVADTARALEKQGDEEIVGQAMQMLRTLYQKNGTAVPDPIQYNITRWAMEPHIWGSYSFFAVDNRKNITAELALPTERLLWAGEATSVKPASVWGAYLSGLREAQRAAEILKEGVAPSKVQGQ